MRITRAMAALVLGAAPMAHAADACVARSGAMTVPLAELYTSEGCSSCPPADRWLSGQTRQAGVNLLAFHVDYWDDIGWKDRFGAPAYSQRQRTRVNARGETTVYTPQVMVGGTVRANWRNAAAWKATLTAARVPARAALNLRIQRDGAGWDAVVGAAPQGGPVDGAQVWLAQYVDAQTTTVRAGENRGATLRHDRVVRVLSGPWPLGDAAAQRVTLDAPPGPWGVTAFVQDAQGNTLQSLSLDAGCARGS